MIWATRLSNERVRACGRRALCLRKREARGSPISPPSRSLAEQCLIGRTKFVAIQPHDFVVAALAQIDGVPVGRNRVVAVGEFADVAAADGGGRAGRWIAAGVLDLAAIDQFADDAGPSQPLEVALRRQLVVAKIDFFAGLPGSAAG